MQNDWIIFLVFVSILLTTGLIFRIRGHRCPRCKSRMKCLARESLDLTQVQTANWNQACGHPPEDRLTFRCPACGYTCEKREPAKYTSDFGCG